MRNGFCPDCDFQNSVNNFFEFFIRSEFGLGHFGVDVCFCNIKLQFVYMKDGFVKLRVLGAVLAVILGGVSLNAAYAGALPAKYEAGLKVLRNAKTNYTPDEVSNYCQKENIPLKPVEPFFKSNIEFCVFAYAADETGKAIQKTGYSTKDTMSVLSNGVLQFELYRQQGMGDLLQPLYGLALVPEGQQFLIKKGLMRQEDVAGFDAIVAYEKQLKEQRNKKPSASCVQSKTAEYSAVAGPLAPQMAEQWCKQYGQ
ncbi:hypothetical protein ACVU8K_004093 [Shigella sonnei]|uniref:hypothetical protein n=1 Tax=Escherichia coli TaxID=562 RepID=UPI001FCE448E|nr:hypothetical protein [Escherichia coli]MDB6994081.1 hypothetical protein [Escherichia coli]MDF1333003.1 hypothetical protein [Escherichia coli]